MIFTICEDSFLHQTSENTSSILISFGKVDEIRIDSLKKWIKTDLRKDKYKSDNIMFLKLEQN